MPPVSELVVWFVLGAVLGVPLGLLVGVLWTPFLASDAVRAALERGPFDRWWVSYVLGFAALGAAHLGGMVGLLVAFGSPATTPDIVVGVPVIAGVGGAALLVRSMGPVEDMVRTYVVVMAGVLWYVLVTVVPSLVLLMFYALPA